MMSIYDDMENPIDINLKLYSKTVTFKAVGSDDKVSRTLLKNKWHEENNLLFIKKLNLPGTYIDVGAHFGCYALFFSNYCMADKVIAIEPNRRLFRKLVTNVIANKDPKIYTLQLCLSSKSGFRNLIKMGDEAAFVEDERKKTTPEYTEAAITTTLDSLDVPCSVIKIDTEGHDIEILLGGIDTIKKNRPHIFLEIWSNEVKKSKGLKENKEDILELMKSLNYNNPIELEKYIHYFKPNYTCKL